MPDHFNNRLDTWKEIAAYLKRDQRTAMRWAKERRLPVHRVPGGKHHSVFAFPQEIDAWLAGQPPENIPYGSAQRGQTNPAAELTAGRERSSPAPNHRPGLRAVLGVVGLGLLGLGGLIIHSWWRVGVPVRANFAGNKLQAWDVEGRLAWEHQFPGTLRDHPDRESRAASQPIRLTDLNGDGHREILALVAYGWPAKPADYRQELDCFSENGHLLWRYSPNITLSFAGRAFRGPWQIEDILVAPDRGTQGIWLAGSHHLWWPSFVVKIKPAGDSQIQFVNSGALYALSYAKTPRGSYILAGGFNNEWDRGVMAVLGEDQPPATSPQTASSAFGCDNCPPAGPRRYFVFPRSEINVAEAIPTDPVYDIAVFEKEIDVSTQEALGGQRRIFDFPLDFDFATVSASLSTGYWRVHKRLERERRIAHTVEKCPERFHTPALREWKDGTWSWLQPTTDVARR